VTGGSAGGELTAWIKGKTNHFRAAAAQKHVINEMSEALTTDQYLGSTFSSGGDPWTREKELWANSPLSLVGSVTTPTLLIVGEQDYRTPIDETLQMYDALQRRDVPTALLTAPGQPMGELRSSRQHLPGFVSTTPRKFLTSIH
jgi:dipeptidyl aminopeptidase/acylaminoacyl peptidase